MILAQSQSLFERGIKGYMMFSIYCLNSLHCFFFLIYLFRIQLCCDSVVKNGINFMIVGN